MGLLGTLGKIVKGVGNVATGGALGAALDYGLPLVAGIAGAKKQGKADQLREAGLQRQTADYNARAPLRSKALTMALQGPGERPDLGSLYGAARNPYSSQSSQPLRVAAPPSQAMPMPTVAPSGLEKATRLAELMSGRGGGWMR